MALFETTRTSNGVADRIALFFNTVLASIVAWNDARVTRNALAALTDRELDDIGLSRGDIDAVASNNITR